MVFKMFPAYHGMAGVLGPRKSDIVEKP